MENKKETSEEKEKYNRLENDRHNDNARAAAAPESNTPRINTDNL